MAFSAPAEDLGRVGIVVPARVGGAVVRNKLKRRVRAILCGLGEPRGSDLVVRLEPSAADLRYQDLENHVARAAGRARS